MRLSDPQKSDIAKTFYSKSISELSPTLTFLKVSLISALSPTSDLFKAAFSITAFSPTIESFTIEFFITQPDAIDA